MYLPLHLSLLECTQLAVLSHRHSYAYPRLYDQWQTAKRALAVRDENERLRIAAREEESQRRREIFAPQKQYQHQQKGPEGKRKDRERDKEKESFSTKEKRKRELGQTSRGTSYVRFPNAFQAVSFFILAFFFSIASCFLCRFSSFLHVWCCIVVVRGIVPFQPPRMWLVLH